MLFSMCLPCIGEKMDKRKSEYMCPNEKCGCKIKFKDDGMNDENFKRHIESCKYGLKEKKKGMSHYINSSPSSSSVAAGLSNSNMATDAPNSDMAAELSNTEFRN